MDVEKELSTVFQTTLQNNLTPEQEEIITQLLTADTPSIAAYRDYIKSCIGRGPSGLDNIFIVGILIGIEIGRQQRYGPEDYKITRITYG